jgi:hypothetical protein
MILVAVVGVSATGEAGVNEFRAAESSANAANANGQEQ